MNLVADENVDREIVLQLRKRKHKVIYVAELHPGIEDEAVLERANALKALLITADKDFGELVFRQQWVTSGVLLFRLADLSSIKKAKIIVDVIENHKEELCQAFSVVTPSGLRIRTKF